MGDELKKHCGMVDLFKFIFAIFVVMIHTQALKSVDFKGFVFTSLGITRIAVPFFFIISGYFTYKHIYNKEKWNSYIKKYLKLYVIWVGIEVVLLLPMVIMYLRMNPVGTIIKIIMCGVTSSLWYLIGVVLSMLVVGPLVRKGYIKTLIGISVFLFIMGLSGDGYFKLFEGTLLSDIALLYSSIFIYMPFGIAMGVPMITIGVLINKYNIVDKFKSATIPLIGTIVFTVLLGIEALVLFEFEIPREFNFYILILIAAPFAAIYALKSKAEINPKLSSFFSDMSEYIYLSHQIFMMWILNFLALKSQMTGKPLNTFLVFSLTLGCAFIAGIILRKFKITRKLILK